MCHIKMSCSDEKDAKRLFYNILIEKPRIERDKNIELRHEI